MFRSEAAGGFVDEDAGGFHLKGTSPLIDAGTFLTETTASGSGTQIPVDDAGYFMDGFDLVVGDRIQLQGQSVTAAICDVDYGTNTIRGG